MQVNYGNWLCFTTAVSLPDTIAFVTTSLSLTVALFASIYVADRSSDSRHSSRQLQSLRYISILEILWKEVAFHIIEYEE